MALSTEQVAETFEDIVVNVPLNCNFPCYVEDEVVVIYGIAGLLAVYPTDFDVNLSPPNFDLFTVTPKAPLLTKINALIAGNPLEENYVTVRRVLDYKTSVQPETVRNVAFLSREIDRIHMRFQQLSDAAKRVVGLAPKNVGGAVAPLYIEAPLDNKLVVGLNGGFVNGPDVSVIVDAGEDAEAAALASIAARDISITAKNDSITAKNDSITAKNASQTAQGLSEAARDTSITAKNDSVTAKNQSVTAQGLSEAARDAAALSAILAASTFISTSTSSVAIGVGAKSYTVQTNKNYAAGMFIQAIDAGNVANWMWGQVTSYNNATGALVIDSQVIGGSGTKTSWVISLSGSRGPQGVGDVIATAVQTLTNKTMDFTLNTFLKVPWEQGFALSDEVTAISTGTDKLIWYAPFACNINSVFISVAVVSTSGLPTVNVKKNGTTIFTTKPTIDANENASNTAATASVLVTVPTALALGDKLSFDIDTAGTGAKGLKATLIGYK